MNKIFNKKTLVITSYIIIISTIILFELLFCNSNIFKNFSTNSFLSDYNFSFVRILLYFIVGFISFKMFKTNFIDEVIDTFKYKTKKKIIIIYFLIACLTLITFLVTLFVFKYQFIVSNISMFFITILLGFLLIIYMTNDHKKNIIITVIILGIIFSFVTMINHHLDEKRHFMSAFNLAVGNFDFSKPIKNNQFIEIPHASSYVNNTNYFNEKYNFILEKLEYGANIADTPAPYNPILYIPSALGIKLGMVFQGSLGDIYYLGRIFNLIAYMLLIILTLKILPYKKNIFYVIFTIPMVLCLAASYSIDGISVALVSLFIAYCLNIYSKEGSITFSNLINLIILYSLVLTIKSFGYSLIGLFVFILPIKKIINDNKKKILYLILLFISLVLIILGIMYFQNNGGISDPRGGNTNVMEQLIGLISNPKHTVIVSVNHVMGSLLNFNWLAYNMNMNLFFSPVAYNIFIIMLFFWFYVSIKDNSKNFSLKAKTIFTGSFISIYAFTSFILYVTFTPVGDLVIKGYQSRYLFPIISLLLMSISNNKISVNYDKNELMKISYVSATFIMISILGTIFIIC